MQNKASPPQVWLSLTLVLLIIEFFDELHYALGGAALPALQAELKLDYAQVGLLLGLPHILGSAIEWAIMLLGDTRLRKWLVIGGGLVVALSVLAVGGATSFPVLLAAVVVSFPASGAFVTLAQATLVDQNPQREAQVMARWTLAGSLGNLAGPLALAGILTVGLSWRWGYGMLGVLALLLTGLAARCAFPVLQTAQHASWRHELRTLWQGVIQVVTNLGLLRWMLLIEIADLMLDVFTSFAALYFANVAGMSTTEVSLVLALLMLGSLAADALAIPLLERFQGRTLVRATAGLAGLLFAGFLTAPWLPVKVGLAVLLKVATLGWYAILKGETYAAVPGKSGTLNAINSLTGLVSGAIPWGVGLAAERFGLQNAMWLLLLGPVCLLLWVPRAGRPEK